MSWRISAKLLTEHPLHVRVRTHTTQRSGASQRNENSKLPYMMVAKGVLKVYMYATQRHIIMSMKLYYPRAIYTMLGCDLVPVRHN